MRDVFMSSDPKERCLPVERNRKNSVLQIEGGQPPSLEADPEAMAGMGALLGGGGCYGGC